MLDKSYLHSAFSGDQWGGEGSAAWRARVVLFVGVALMAGGLAGSLVSHVPPWSSVASVLRSSLLKYIIPDYQGYIYYGGANVGMNAGIMIS